MKVAEFLERAIDEIIALLFAVFFLAVTSALALGGKIDDLKTFASVVAPFISAIIGFYFAKRAVQETAEAE